jgi:hypothetical protein
MEHGPYIAERTQNAVYIVRCLWWGVAKFSSSAYIAAISDHVDPRIFSATSTYSVSRFFKFIFVPAMDSPRMKASFHCQLKDRK